VTNLDGTWPVTAAGASATSFSVLTSVAVTASAVARAGTIVRSSDTLIKTRSLTIGSDGEQVSSPTDGTIKTGDANGTNATGANLTIRSGANTGSNSTGGNIFIQTPTSGSSGAVQQAQTTRITIATNGLVTIANDATISGRLGVGSAALAANRIYATQGLGSPTILGNNSFTVTSGMAGVAGTTTSAGSGYLGYFNGTVRAGVFGQIGTFDSNVTTYAGYFDGRIGLAGDLVTPNTTIALVNTTATTVNFAGAATALTIGATTGTTTIRNATVAVTNAATVGTTLTVNHSITSTAEVTGITTATVVDSWDYATYRSAKYQVQVTCTAGANINTYQVSEILVIHNGSTATMTEYGVSRTGAAELATFTVDISGANARLLATAPGGDTIKVKVHRVALTA
jgi:hypothetical protein